MDKEVLNLAITIAEKMVLKEIQKDNDTLLRIIKEALNYIAEGTTINIRVNPEEFKILKENFSQNFLPSHKINLIPDNTISKGGVIETSLGVIDATFEKRWKRIIDNLLKDEG